MVKKLGYEYKIIENPPNKKVCEETLNVHAKDGWRVISFGQFQICLERENKNEETEIKQIHG